MPVHCFFEAIVMAEGILLAISLAKVGPAKTATWLSTPNVVTKFLALKDQMWDQGLRCNHKSGIELNKRLIFKDNSYTAWLGTAKMIVETC